ncbi:MAG TPA: thioredoxin [Chromatiales bacterium]|nr:thioredoxin [Chromatiales bacterium]
MGRILPRPALALAGALLALAALPAGAGMHPTRLLAERLLAEVDDTTWFAEGTGRKVLYVVIDPNCPYCHKLWERLRGPVERGELQVRWIIVGYLTSTSLGKAAAILQAEDPVAALRVNEEDFGFRDEDPGGGIEPLPEEAIRDETRLALAANLALMQNNNLFGVPLAFFRAADGRGFMFEGAPPPDVLKELLSLIDEEPAAPGGDPGAAPRAGSGG